MIYRDIKMLGTYSCRKLWSEKYVLLLIKKMLLSFQWFYEGAGSKILNFVSVFVCDKQNSWKRGGEKVQIEKQMKTNGKVIHRMFKKGKLRIGRTMKACMNRRLENYSNNYQIWWRYHQDWIYIHDFCVKYPSRSFSTEEKVKTDLKSFAFYFGPYRIYWTIYFLHILLNTPLDMGRRK